MAVATEGEIWGSLQAALSQRPRSSEVPKINKVSVDHKRIHHAVCLSKADTAASHSSPVSQIPPSQTGQEA